LEVSSFLGKSLNSNLQEIIGVFLGVRMGRSKGRRHKVAPTELLPANVQLSAHSASYEL